MNNKIDREAKTELIEQNRMMQVAAESTTGVGVVRVPSGSVPPLPPLSCVRRFTRKQDSGRSDDIGDVYIGEITMGLAALI